MDTVFDAMWEFILTNWDLFCTAKEVGGYVSAVYGLLTTLGVWRVGVWAKRGIVASKTKIATIRERRRLAAMEAQALQKAHEVEQLVSLVQSVVKDTLNRELGPVVVQAPQIEMTN